MTKFIWLIKLIFFYNKIDYNDKVNVSGKNCFQWQNNVSEQMIWMTKCMSFNDKINIQATYNWFALQTSFSWQN